jgi:hypothetical protein
MVDCWLGEVRRGRIGEAKNVEKFFDVGFSAWRSWWRER